MMEHRFPVVLGKDFAGEVDAVGPDVEGYQVGDRVFGVVMKDALGDGSFGEYVTVPVAFGIAKLPEGSTSPRRPLWGWPGRLPSMRSTQRTSPPARRCWSSARPAGWVSRRCNWPCAPAPP
jgi:Alcohol dehydrogenase GroES-like domain